MALTIADEPILATEDELPLLRALADRLDAGTTATLVGADDEPIELPASAYRALAPLIRTLAKGDAVGIVPIEVELTLQEAGELLLLPGPALLEVIARGDLPAADPNELRPIRLADLLAFRRSRVYRHELLKQMARDDQAMGLYDEEYPIPPDDEQP